MAFKDFYVLTTASDNNGGTSEGAADVSGTAGATSGTTTVDLSSDTPDLSGVAAGDAIRIAGETNGINGTDVFEISAADDGADTVTVVQTPGTASGLTWAIGGSWATIDRAMNVVAAGDKVWVKATADYVNSAAIDTAGTNTAPIVFEGYTSTTGDGGKATIDGTDNTLASCLTTTLGLNTGGYYAFKNFVFRDCTSHGVALINLQRLTFKNCIARDNGGGGFQGRLYLNCYNCVAFGNGSPGGFYGFSTSYFHSCVAYANTGYGIKNGAGGLEANCLCFDNSTYDIHDTGIAPVILGCTVDGDDATRTITGIQCNAGSFDGGVFVNNIVYDCNLGMYWWNTNGERTVSEYNLFNDNATDYSSAGTFSGEVTTAPQFTNEVGDDYTLASGSPAKAAGVDAGDPVNGTSYVDIGAHQRQEAGGGMLVHPGASGGARG